MIQKKIMKTKGLLFQDDQKLDLPTDEDFLKPGNDLPDNEDSDEGAKPGDDLPEDEDSDEGVKPGGDLPDDEDSDEGAKPGGQNLPE